MGGALRGESPTSNAGSGQDCPSYLLKKRTMNTLSDTYTAQFHACALKPEHAAEVRAEAGRILANRARYAAVAAHFTALPWWAVGILHSMECGLDFHAHLHNGDPLTARTVQVPRGRPLTGSPPFTWEESARDALVCDGLDKAADWSPGGALVTFENYNGTGYRRKGVPSPYLWSFTDQYRCGKYTADGHYDAQAVSRQCGCAALLQVLLSVPS
jgi:lysozyme family protein